MTWTLQGLDAPFPHTLPGIFDHLRAHPGAALPDEDRVFPPGQIRWVAGGMDGVLTHHGSARAPERAKEVFSALVELHEAATSASLARLYRAILGAEGALPIVDDVTREIRADRSRFDPGRVAAIGEWLATRSPDREPVKIGIALMGLVDLDERRGLIETLGRHDELTLYAVVALAAEEDGEVATWEVAQDVHGWGRVHAVERLARTEDPRIKRWLVREGYRNDVMNEYLAWTAATTGDLLGELSAESIDDELLRGAGEILVALMNGGPAEDMDGYEDGAEVTRLFLDHLLPRASSLDAVLTANAIGAFVSSEKADWEARAGRGWTPELRAEVREDCAALVAQARWRDAVRKGLATADLATFHQADAVARLLKIDTWENHLARIERDGARSLSWHQAAGTDDPVRFERVLHVASERLDLAKVATGPADDPMGYGPGFETHRTLDALLGALGRFPGRGEAFVVAGLASPVTRNRNLALRVLADWGRDRWPAGVEERLRAGAAAEPDAEVRARIERLLAGQPLEG